MEGQVKILQANQVYNWKEIYLQIILFYQEKMNTFQTEWRGEILRSYLYLTRNYRSVNNYENKVVRGYTVPNSINEQQLSFIEDMFEIITNN